MAKTTKARPIQTEVKHVILREYIGAWGGIILGGISRSPVKEAHFDYVDANASRGWFSGDQSDAIDEESSGIVDGSPIIGIEEFDKLVNFAQQHYGIRLRVNAILVEKDFSTFQELLKTLQQKGYGNRLVINPTTLTSLKDQQIAVFNDDSTLIIDRIVQFTSSDKIFAFYFLDPYGAGGIPLVGYVKKVISLPRHDVIINFPYLDLHKKTGLAQKEQLTMDQEERLRACDRMFGHNRWRNLANTMDAETDQDCTFELEQQLVDCYRQSLQRVDVDLAVKAIRMRFPDRERTMYYLFLTTHDSTGALEINKELWNAKLTENELRWQLRVKRSTPLGQLSLFDTPAPPPPDQPEGRPTKDEIADEVFKLLQGKRMKLRDVYKVLADEPFFVNEVKSALTMLRRQKRLNFQGDLKNETELQFDTK